MRLITIGDVHGRLGWKHAVNNIEWDKVVFVGDYFDNYTNLHARVQIDNFLDIIAFKNANPDKVTLLWGNHDQHYLPGIEQVCSGYQQIHAIDIGEVVWDAYKNNLVQMCHKEGKFLFSHAGITKTWYKNTFGKHPYKKVNIVRNINRKFKREPHVFNYTPGRRFDPYGNEVCQTPIWVRPMSLQKDGVGGYRQVVGHTVHNKITFDGDHIFIDAPGKKECLVIENGKPIIEKYV